MATPQEPIAEPTSPAAAPTATPADAPATGADASPVALDWLQRNRNVVFGVAAVLVAAAIGASYYFIEYLPARNREAWNEMSSAQRFFEQDSLDKALNGTSQYSGFEAIADEYAGTKAGDLAQLYLGQIYLRQNKYEQAIEALESYSKAKTMLGVSAYAALAQAYEAQKEFEKAADNYRRAADLIPNSQTTPYYWLQAGRVLEYADENEKAVELYRRIEREYPLSAEGQEVEKYIARASAASSN